MRNEIRLEPARFPARDSESIALEGVLHYVPGEGTWPAAVVCHPHPMGGGTMHNPVVTAITRALATRGIMALRFNFRGVGKSGGRHEGGRGEQADVAGALDWLLDRPGVDPWLVASVGYSFGAGVALAEAASDPRVTALVAVGLVADHVDASSLQTFTRPKLFITGERDDVAPPGPLRRFVDRLPPEKQVAIVPGADHFWRGHQKQLGARVADFLTDL
jgi:alpha/beta superfamily hydrolase